ncbi:hypothetical protein PLESTB_001210700 [Pleodorina starrii]|uniref:EF-hand domain-containing protein n=1 Tax=Pleodorina starrii TaxID=330485 RepID=A0A9W6F5S3_9CHLO|nr:hypothetical protein PLESTM_001648400 [Pleodorina starrii]GLC57314.1 hypothetical protein PLESTB_001210700 [Pleodorina starrii]GLC71287.1 hypothetical protein PLESTF_001099300 [Pleodorina starrii]
MAYFGLTSYGPQEPLRDVNKVSHDYIFHTIAIDQYVEAFNKYLIGDSDVAVVMEVSGDTHILRAKLGDILKDVLGRQPRKIELDCWFTHLDFDRSGVMGLDEYLKGLERLMAFSAGTVVPATFTSYDTQRVEWIHHTRVGYEPQQTLRAPLTTAQEVGWHAPKPTPPEAQVRRSLNSTDVTQREGRDAASYYGHFICNH